MIAFKPRGYILDRSGIVLHPDQGSIEHYYHFLLGYLLPLTWFARSAREVIRIIDCGPVMNRILEETLSSCGFRWEYWDRWKPFVRVADLPRWDFFRDDPSEFSSAITSLSARLNAAPDCPRSDCPKEENLFLLRSPEPDFYTSEGAALIKGYGSGTRKFANVDEVQDELNAKGIRYSAYEPGGHNLKCQMISFRSASRVFGIRGAEFSNVIWMKRDSVIHLVFENGKTTPYVPELAKFLKIKVEISVHDETTPVIESASVEKFFQPSGWPSKSSRRR